MHRLLSLQAITGDGGQQCLEFVVDSIAELVHPVAGAADPATQFYLPSRAQGKKFAPAGGADQQRVVHVMVLLVLNKISVVRRKSIEFNLLP